MNAHPEIVPSLVDRIKQTLVALKMPRAIEILDAILRRLEHGEITAIEAIDSLLAEELTLRENRRIKIALMMARLSSIKTLAGFDFSFQPSLDKNRIMALAELEFVDRREVVHFLGPPGTGKSHLSLALGVQAIKAGRSVYFTPLSDLVSTLAKAEREGTLREKIRFFCRFSLLIVDEIGYLLRAPSDPRRRASIPRRRGCRERKARQWRRRSRSRLPGVRTDASGVIRFPIVSASLFTHRRNDKCHQTKHTTHGLRQRWSESSKGLRVRRLPRLLGECNEPAGGLKQNVAQSSSRYRW